MGEPVSRRSALIVDAPRPRSLWGQQVFTAALELRGRLELAGTDPAGAGEIGVSVYELTQRAMELAAKRPLPFGPHRLGEWWTGSRVETCWTYLHAAEVQLAGIDSPAVREATISSALTYARRLDEDDPDRAELLKQIGAAR